VKFDSLQLRMIVKPEPGILLYIVCYFICMKLSIIDNTMWILN